jgi:two-component system, NarL family, response regulator DesR
LHDSTCVVKETIRLLLVDGQILSRGVLRQRLERERDLEVVAEVGGPDDVVATAKRLRANVAVIDVASPGLDGIAITAALRTSMPECRVLMLTTYGRPGFLQRGLDAGASFALKNSTNSQLADAVRRVHRGLRVVDANLAAETLRYSDCPLNEPETEVLRAARDGGTVAELAELLAMPEVIVRGQLSSAIGKTGARTRAEAVVIAERNGWLLY